MNIDQQKLHELINKYPIRMLILFGSAARLGLDSAADIDIAVSAAPEFYESMAFLDFSSQLEDVFPDVEKEIDLVPIRTEDPVLLSQIARDGKLLYESTTDQFSKFKLFASFFAEDQERYLEKRYNKQRLLKEVKAL